MPDIYINTDRPVDRSIVAGINQPQREAPVGAFVAGSSYDTNIYFVLNDGSYDPASGSVNADVQVAISTISDPISGSYTLTDGLAITGDIVYGSSAKSVQDALNALNGGTGPNLGSPGLVDVVKNSDTQYTITFRTFGAKTALNGNTVSLYPESTPTGSIAVNGSATEYAQQVIEIVRQPSIYQPNWTEITNGFNATLSLNTTRLLQSLVVDNGQPFYIEVKLDGETVAREVVGMELSTMPASAFSGVVIQSLLDQFAANPLSNSYFDAASWVAALGDLGGVTSVNGQVGDVFVATTEQGALADTAVQPASTDTLTNKTIADISNNVHADLLHLHVRATEPILKGQAVKFDGYNQGQSSIEVSLADQATDISIGLAQSDIANNALGLVATSGVLEGVDTSNFAEGAILYVNGSGNLQELEPPTGFSQPIALCLRSNQNNGVLDILADYPKQPASDVRNDSTVTGATVKDALEYLETNLGIQTWGGITGTLSNQTDLQNALDAKQNILAEGAFVDGDKTKLDGISPGAQVNDPTTLLDSDIGTTVQAHSTILDNTTASFTTADETKLDAIIESPTLGDVTSNGASTTNDISVGRIVTLHPSNPANNNSATGNQACSIGGVANVVNGNRSVSYGGRENQVLGNDSSTIGGFGQIVNGQEAEGLGSTDTTLNTKYTTAIGTINSVVGLGTQGTSSNASKHSSVLGGDTNIIESATEAVIVGGTTNTIQSTHHRSVILGGQNITTDAADTAYVPNLNVGSGFKMPTGATDKYVLTTNANGVGTWQENLSAGSASFAFNDNGASDQIIGDIPANWRNVTRKPNDQLIIIGTSCTDIGSLAFVGHNNSDGGLHLPDSVLTIGTFAFQSYAGNSLTKGTLRLPVNLTRVEMGVFQLAKFSGELNLPSGLTYIGTNAFAEGIYGGDLTIPNQVTEVGLNGFYNNSFSGNLTLPTSLTTVGSGAFRNNAGLTTCDCYTTKTAIDVTNSLNGTSIATIHARATDATWTAGAGQTIGDKTGITVIKDLT